MPNININSIPANSMVYVNGIVDYCRIASQIDGEELKASNARRVSLGSRAIEKPHTTITLRNCSVDYANPNAPTQAELFIAEKFYASKAHPENSPCYTGYNKSKNLPTVYARESLQSSELEKIMPEGEVAPGVPVTIILRFFSSAQNNGVSLDAVIVNEKPIKWFNRNITDGALKARGFTIADNAPNVEDVRAQLEAEQPAAVAAPFPASAPAPAPASYAAPTVPVSPSLPKPPDGYGYDAQGRCRPLSELNGDGGASGGIKL